MSQEEWERHFVALNKQLFSAELVKGYDMLPVIETWAKRNDHILDFGCGTGQMVQKLRQGNFANVFGADPSKQLLEHSDVGRSYPDALRHIEGSRLPFADAEFDLVYTSGVLHHIAWDDLPGVFSEIRRVLRVGGIFIYMEPRDSLVRRLGHSVVSSPLKRLSRQLRSLDGCLRAEWPTYSVWLSREEEAWAMLDDAGLAMQMHRRQLVTSTVVFRAMERAS